MKLAINLATRGRPELLTQTVKRTLENIVRPDTLFMVSVDADDKPSIEAMDKLNTKIFLSIAEREDALADKWNRVVDCQTDADVYMTMADDAPLITRGFDQIILDAAARFPDGIGCVYNHLENASFPAITAPTAKLVRMMGGIIWPGLWPYWFCDHWLTDIVALIGRISFADVRADSSAHPPTMGMREPAFWATFFDAGYLTRRRLAHSIIKSEDFLSPEWQKELLLRQYPLVEYRSRWINDQVRGLIAPAVSGMALDPPEERYLRVKRKALDLMREWLPDLEAEARHDR